MDKIAKILFAATSAFVVGWFVKNHIDDKRRFKEFESALEVIASEPGYQELETYSERQEYKARRLKEMCGIA